MQVLFPPDGRLRGEDASKGAQTDAFELHKAIDEQMGFHEKLRLLYVACTRARDHLVVSVHRTDARARPTTTTALDARRAALGRGGATRPWTRDRAGARRLALPADGRAAAPAPSRSTPWLAEHDAAFATGARRAVRLGDHARARSTDDAAADDPGLAKEGRDLELPPWNKGRYGTAIGRAVHAVLQTVDLATGAGLADLAAAQAAAEGVLGHEATIVALAQSALASPTVARRVRRRVLARDVRRGAVRRAHARGLRRPRVPRPDADGGLVVVDYKTDAIETDAMLASRLAHYRIQAAAYAIAVAAATGERVDRCVFVFLVTRRRARGRVRGRRARGRGRRGPGADPDRPRRPAAPRRRGARPTPEPLRAPPRCRMRRCAILVAPVKAARFFLKFVVTVALGAAALAASLALLVPASRTLAAAASPLPEVDVSLKAAAAALVRLRPQRQRDDDALRRTTARR